jgi:predicted RNA-binding protein with PIN domain
VVSNPTGTADETEADETEADGVLLPEPARQRLVAVAAEVLGRLPSDDIPAALRPVARFTPAKRLRLGAGPLAAALDADAGFRSRVADVVAQASAQLAEAVRTGGSTTASDPLDAAVLAYLLRPSGWQRTLGAAVERWARQRRDLDRGEQAAELDRLRAELADVRAQLRAGAARTRTAVVAASGQSGAELSEVRRQLRARTAELEATRQARDEALAVITASTARATADESARAADERRLRARISELERALEAARRSGRLERDVDEARLWLLSDTLIQAAAGIRRELSLPAVSVRPADTVAGGLLGGATSADIRHADDTATLDQLLELPHVHLIVDGYNVTMSGYGELPLADQRRRLLGGLAGLAARTGIEVTVAFDGGGRPASSVPTPRGVRVLFSATDEIADDLIRRLVAAEPRGRALIVVSTDQQVAMDVRGAGAWSVPSAVLLARLEHQ